MNQPHQLCHFILFSALSLSLFSCGIGEDTGTLPSITSVTTEAGKSEGPVTGGTQVTLRGSNFAPDAQIFFGDIAAKSTTVKNSETIIAETESVFRAEAVSVSVTTGGQIAKKTAAFLYTPLIAFTSSRSPNFEIFTMGIDGKELRQVTNNALGLQPPQSANTSQISPSFSSNGRELIFSSNKTGHFAIFIMGREGTTPTQITQNLASNQDPSFSPIDDDILFASNRKDINNLDGDMEIFLIDRGGGNLRQLTFNLANDRHPTFSPDGQQILFVSDRDGDRELFLMDRGGGNLQQLTHNTDDDFDPAFSPEGTQILFVSNRSGENTLHLIDRAGGNPVQLTAGQGEISGPTFLPRIRDHVEILFSSDKTENREIYILPCTEIAGVITGCDEVKMTNISLHIATDVEAASSP